ncbi:MAG: YafY family protein [Pseudomonadota bacterium]
MRRADRLFRIVQLLRGGRLVTSARLAEALEVSQRTIYRDIVDLQASGVPIEGEAGVGYVMQAGYDLPPLMFSEDEITALVAGARMIRAFGGAEMARGAEEALIKIAAVLPERAANRAKSVEIHAVGTCITPALRTHLDATEAAIENRQRLRFAYADGAGHATQRSVRPLGLWFWGRVWTLIAWCELRADFRMFRVDRMREISAGAPFRAEPGRGLRDFYRKMEDEAGASRPPGFSG